MHYNTTFTIFVTKVQRFNMCCHNVWRKCSKEAPETELKEAEMTQSTSREGNSVAMN